MVSSACNTIGQYGAQLCTKLGEWGGQAGTWMIETGSELAVKVKEFVMTTVWPALQKFWEMLSSLGGSAAKVSKQHPYEAAALGATGGLVGTVAGFFAGWACCGGKNVRSSRGS